MSRLGENNLRGGTTLPSLRIGAAGTSANLSIWAEGLTVSPAGAG